jgi:hypothetical protein
MLDEACELIAQQLIAKFLNLVLKIGLLVLAKFPLVSKLIKKNTTMKPALFRKTIP